MSQRRQSILLPLFIVLVSAVGTLAFMIKHPRVVSERIKLLTGWTLLAIPDSGEGGLDDNPLPIHQRAADSPDGADGRHLLRSPRRVHAGR